jgi:hypothetical protein
VMRAMMTALHQKPDEAQPADPRDRPDLRP